MTTNTIDRALQILELFDDKQPVWSVENACKSLGFTTSTGHRYFKSLTKTGMLYSFEPGQYTLGPGIVQLDRQIRRHDPLVTAAQGEMLSLAQKCGDNTIVLLARLYRDKVMCVHEEFLQRRPFNISYERGRLMPLYRGSVSKVILANMSSSALRLLKKKGRLTDSNSSEPFNSAELREIKSQGICITEGEVDPGVKGIAVPIYQKNQTVTGSLSLVVKSDRGDIDRLIEPLIMSRKTIEASLAMNSIPGLSL